MDKDNKYGEDNINTGKNSSENKKQKGSTKQQNRSRKSPSEDQPNTKDIKHPEVEDQDERDREDGSGEMLGGRI